MDHDADMTEASPGPAEDLDNYDVHKRELNRPQAHVNDLYVSRKSSFQAQLKRAYKLLFIVGLGEVVVHGVGAATNMAVNVALEMQRLYPGALFLGATTSTVAVVDDLVPTDSYWRAHPDAKPDTQLRRCSAIHIRIVRTKALQGAVETGGRETDD